MLQSKQQSSKGVWLIALGAAMWGLDGVFIVALLQHLTSSQIVWLEHLLLFFFAAPVLVWKRHELKQLNRGDWFAVLFIGWGGSALASILFTAGFTHGNPNVVLLLQKLQPIFVILLASWMLKERMSKDFYVLLVTALIGAYFLTFGLHIPTSDLNSSQLIGSLYAIGAAALWGGSTVMGKRLVSKVSFTTLTALRFSIALPLLTFILFAQHPDWTKIGQALTFVPVWSNLLYQTLVPSLLSLLLYYRGLNGVRASYATIAELAFPATGLLLNWLILNQTIDLGQWVGFTIVWLAVLKLSRMESVTRTEAPKRANWASL
jgi:drug/metabolite transporter (DMT)-like permease